MTLVALDPDFRQDDGGGGVALVALGPDFRQDDGGDGVGDGPEASPRCPTPAMTAIEPHPFQFCTAAERSVTAGG
ncbi:hypothetical protein SPHINGOT1_20038 [Sphingomonas sp. T1]|nr:hypothetical protein SPHINGOT1_20038 [Sphingomonas sp. T1]